MTGKTDEIKKKINWDEPPKTKKELLCWWALVGITIGLFVWVWSW